MANEFMCQFGNCTKLDTPILVSVKGDERSRFCCEEHAAVYLIRKAQLRHAMHTFPQVTLFNLEATVKAALSEIGLIP